MSSCSSHLCFFEFVIDNNPRQFDTSPMQGWGKVGARSGQNHKKARFRQGLGKLAVIRMFFILIIPSSLSPASITY